MRPRSPRPRPRCRRQGVEAIAICFLHSYLNDAHERRAAEIVGARLPHVYLSTSSGVLPEFREFERFSTTAINAYVGPRMERYLDRLLGSAVRARADRAAVHHSLERRTDVGGDGPAISGALLPVGSGGRRRGRRGGRARGRLCQPDHVRCRRHLDRRVADRARRAGIRLRSHDRGLSGSFTDGRRPRDRRRRRLDRLAGRRRRAEGRAAQRGRRSGTGRLWSRRHSSRR